MKHAKSKSSTLTIRGRPQEKLVAKSVSSKGEVSLFDPQVQAVMARLRGGGLVVRDPNRVITVQASMFVLDDEWGSDEKVWRQQSNSAILSSQGITQTVMVFEVHMGGEIFVEFTVTAELIDSYGNAQVHCDLKLYEGTDEYSDDLDGEREFVLYVPAGRVVNHFVRVNNDDEGGDYATVSMSVSNSSQAAHL